ncbi:MAG TPA: hypothetical protein DCW35_01375 [Polynucleobacter sp.]|nr:hypothetical protein [Polynucleobacter sp.]
MKESQKCEFLTRRPGPATSQNSAAGVTDGHLSSSYFNNGKGIIALEKGVLVMGEWRLSSIEKEMATLTHSTGSSLILKAFKSEAN